MTSLYIIFAFVIVIASFVAGAAYGRYVSRLESEIEEKALAILHRIEDDIEHAALETERKVVNNITRLHQEAATARILTVEHIKSASEKAVQDAITALSEVRKAL